MTTGDTTNRGADALLTGAVRGGGRSPEQLAAVVDATKPLTVEQRAIVSAGLEPALVVAGAGSGKTETLSMRVLYLLDNAASLFGRDISPDEILVLTFTRKAAAEISDRAAGHLAKVFGPDAARPEVTVATYNGYAASLSADHGLRVGVDPDSNVLTDAALWQLADSVVESWSATVETDSAVSTVTAAIPRLAAQMKDHRVTPEQLREWAEGVLAEIDALPKKAGDAVPGALTAALQSKISKIRTLAAMAGLVADFDRRKREGSYLDFSDQVEVAVRLSALEAVQAIERARFRAVLLDEFQDTSPPQLDLFATMFGSDHCVMAVGDPNQAIYGFRGASADALEQFVARFGGDGVAQHSLSVSWRNEASILAAANAVVEPLVAEGLAGVSLRSKEQALSLPEPARSAPGVIASRHLTLEQEAAAVVGFVVGRKAELASSQGGTITAAVLCRRRSQYAALADAFSAAGVDFEIVGLGGLLDTPEVADVLALLQVAHDPTRGDSLMRLLTGERIALGPRDLAALYDWAEVVAGRRDEREGNASIVDALSALPGEDWVSFHGRSLSDKARERLESLSATVAATRAHTYLTVAELVLFAERAWCLDVEAAVARPNPRARRAIDAFVDAARTFALGAEHATLGAFLAWLDAARAEERGLDMPLREPDPAAVQLLTVHAAKGLEWDVVAVPGLDDGHFPSVSPPSNATPFYSDGGWLDGAGNLPYELRLDRAQLPVWRRDGLADHAGLKSSLAGFQQDAGAYALHEERRLFYVALTRARSHVLLSGSWFGSGKRVFEPSMYVEELIEVGAAAVGAWAERPVDGAAPPDVERPPGVWPGPPSPVQQRRRELRAEVEAALATLAPDAPWPDGPLSSQITAMLSERAARASADVPMPAHLSTSALVSLRRDRDDFAMQLRRPMPQEPTLAAHRGSALHAWIERQYGHTVLIDDDLLDVLGEDPTGGGDVSGKELEALKATFARSEWARRSPSDVEVDVELPVGGVTVRSRIDAVFPPGAGLDKVTVVDWKSGRPPRDENERAAREVQLAVYRLAWSEWKSIPIADVDAAFYYVASDQTVRPERLLGREEVVNLIRGES